MIEEEIFSYLRRVPEVTALVGDRIYPLLIFQDKPNKQPPWIIYEQISSSPGGDLSGKRWTRTRLQFSCYGTSYASAKQVAKAVEKALHNYQGNAGQLYILGSSVVNAIGLYEPDLELYHVPVDVVIIYGGA